jgi:hypothetical protein
MQDEMYMLHVVARKVVGALEHLVDRQLQGGNNNGDRHLLRCDILS